MDKSQYKEKMFMPNPDFPMKFFYQLATGNDSLAFDTHWHFEMELLYITNGTGIATCDNQSFHVKKGDLIVANCNELHALKTTSPTLEYQCIILDPSILNGRIVDPCDSKFIRPILENRILFKNHISEDVDVQGCINSIMYEYTHRELGYELSIKSALYYLFVLLMRHHIGTTLTDHQIQFRTRNIQRFNTVIKYIHTHYPEDLSVDQLSDYAHMSKYHFCRMFKKMTGDTVSHYINTVRVIEAEKLLLNTGKSITEISYDVGFHDASYFSKTYKSIKKTSPRSVRKEVIE